MSNLDCFDFDYFSVEKQTGKNKIKKKKNAAQTCFALYAGCTTWK